MISDICSLVIPRTRFRAVAAQKAEDGNATPADRNVQPSTLTSFQQLRGRVVQHWHSAEKYANNRYTSAQNSTRNLLHQFPIFLFRYFQLVSAFFLRPGQQPEAQQKASQLEQRKVTTFQQMQPQGPFPRKIDMCVPTWGSCSKFERGWQDCRDSVRREPQQIRLSDLVGSIHRKHIPEMEVPNVAAPV